MPTIILKDFIMNDTLHYMMLITQSRISRQILQEAAKLGLSPSQPKVLEYLTHNEGCTQMDICRALVLDKSTITGILARMEEVGLIEIKRDKTDKRKTVIMLSEAGRKASDDMEKIFSDVDSRLWGDIPEENRTDFIETLKKIYENIAKAD